MCRFRRRLGIAAAAATASILLAPGLAAADRPNPPSVQDNTFEVRTVTFPVRTFSFPVRTLTFPVQEVQTQSQTSDNQTQVDLSADVLFEFDKATLTPVAQQLLNRLAPQIADQARGTVSVDGYTDSIGDSGYNETLSQQRADAVKAFLARALAMTPGASLQLNSTGHGASDFVASNTKPDGSDNPAGRAQNRRVTISYPTS